MTKFILLADRRSGTTLVIDCLTGHPGINCAKRAFGQEKKIRNPTENHHSSDFYLYRTASLANRGKYYLQKKQLIKSFLDERVFTPRPGIRAAGNCIWLISRETCIKPKAGNATKYIHGKIPDTSKAAVWRLILCRPNQVEIFCC